MSITPLPSSPRKVHLWGIFLPLIPAMKDPLPAELKFRENTGPGLRGEKMQTYAIWHGFLAA